MELVCITSSFQQNQEQKDEEKQQRQRETSLIQSNSYSKNTDDFFEKKPNVIQQFFTSESIASTSQIAVKLNDNIDDNNSEQFENDCQRQQRSFKENHELAREKLVRFVYFGQAILIIIVALAWVSFMVLEPKMISVNITMN